MKHTKAAVKVAIANARRDTLQANHTLTKGHTWGVAEADLYLSAFVKLERAAAELLEAAEALRAMRDAAREA
jgi:hypothetical protein